MIEATCSACGTLNRVAEASVPVGAKFVTCADCKSRISIGGPAGSSTNPRLPPPIPKPSAPSAPSEVLDLADLPAPKRSSALGGEPSKPASRSALPPRSAVRGVAAALDPDLPAPKARAAPMPAITAAPTMDLDDHDLGAGGSDAGMDLLAPKGPSARSSVEPLHDEVVDLPAPKRGPDLTDLLAPKRSVRRDAEPAAPAARAPTRAAAAPISDLPAPKRGPNLADLPTPRMADLQPKVYNNVDLPAPKGFFDDLPQPKANPRSSPAAAQPAGPAASAPAAPAPEGFFDDLPRPADNQHGGLPAPKGFFDDLPQPALRQRPELPAPKGFFDDLPQAKSRADNAPEVPAPKGYFENIPALPNRSKPELPAPQGFFDDIPGLPRQGKPELPVPKGHFENLPGRPSHAPSDLAPRGFFDDLPQPDGATGGPASHDGRLELDGGPELDLVPPSSAGAAAFDDLDLSKPTAPIRFDGPRTARGGGPSTAPMGGDGQMRQTPAFRTDTGSLEIEGRAPEGPELRQAPKRPARPVVDQVAVAATSRRRMRLALAGLAIAVVVGGGGFVLYQRHAAAQDRAETIARELAAARKAYADSDPPHWLRAASAARRVLDVDGKNPEALGLAAESLLASAIGDGIGAAGKLGQARTLLDTANDAGIASPHLARARALVALAGHQPDAAIAQLQPIATAAPTDGTAALYLGWALAAKGDAAGALKAFDAAAADPSAQVGALYARGNARLSLADLEGARSDFAAVLQLARDHIGAQVGLAAAQPPAAAQQAETDLLAILARRDITAADPRVVALAWTLAGSAAAHGGRTAVARERFRKALVVAPQDLAAMTGLAETELADGKVTSAADLMATALNLAKDDVPAQLVQCEIEIKQNKLPLAAERLAAIAGHGTPLPPLVQARLDMVTGKLLEAQGKDDAAVEAYTQGARAAGDLDLAPLMAAVGKLAALTQAALAAKDLSRADELRGRSEQLLGNLADHAEHDPLLAMTLGTAYLQQGDAAKAERWLTRVTEARPSDAEARFQLGRALLAEGKSDDALASLKAALDRDPARSDIGIELAHAYEAVGRDAEAGALYAKLLAGRDPGLELRGRAGRYYARIGAFDKAGQQGAKIVEAEAKNAAGLYLLGEGQLAAGKALEAKQTFQRAIEVERDPQYLDALGRAAETLAQNGDRELQDLALRSYQASLESPADGPSPTSPTSPTSPAIVPRSFNALAGQGRLYVARHEAAKAIPPLLTAARIEPRNADVMFLIGAAYQELQQSSTALQWLEASTKIAPRAEAFWRIGQIRRDANQGPQAADAIASATRLATESEKRTGHQVGWLTDALYLQGRVNFDLHNDPRAREAWTQYVARNPPSSARLVEVQQLLATSLHR